CNEVNTGLWVGRRVFPGEIPHDVQTLVDMTAELPLPRGIQVEYISVPTLDTSFPNREELVEIVRRVCSCPWPLYINCASGHGRSAALAAAILISRGEACTVEEAERIIKTA